MTKESIKSFYNNLFGSLEVLDVNGVPYFPSTKVASILGYSNPRAAVRRHCSGGARFVHPFVTNGGIQETEFIDKENLNRLIMGSKLPNVEIFKTWLFSEVIPMIERTGMYFTQDTYDYFISNPGQLGNMLIQYQQQLDQLKQENQQMKPGYEKWNNWLSGKNLYTVHQASHILGIKGMGLKNLFKYFREKGYVSQDNIAFRQYQDQGLFRVKELDTITKNGYRYHRFQTFLTPTDINFFRDKLLAEGYTDLDFFGEPEGFISEYVAA